MKTAVILAAGIGSRLRPLTLQKPKCMVRVAGVPILEHQIAAYEKAGFDKIYVIVGFCADIIRAWLATKPYGALVGLIENAEFDSTNNMYSLSLLAPQLAGKPFYLSNGDVVFDPAILERAAQTHPGGSVIAVDKSLYNEESMKIVADKAGAVTGISKKYTEAESFATSIDLYRFSANASRALFEIVDDYINKRGDRYQWTEVALDGLLHKPGHDFQPADIAGSRWMEIDNLADLAQAELLFCAQRKAILEARAFVFDIDGTLIMGGQPIPGAQKTVERLQKNRPVFFCTNNSSLSRAEHAAQLQKFGFKCRAEDILSSTAATITYLKTHRLKRIHVLGTPALQNELQAAGFDIRAAEPELVVVGFDTTLTFEKAAQATRLIAKGCPYILTHPDPACPTPEGPIPDAGAIAALIQAATGVAPQAVLGKPSREMLAPLFAGGTFKPAETVVVGDRLSTDMRMAIDSGCLPVLVLSGITSRLDADRSDARLALIIDSVAGLDRLS